ncbi:hypothetical protein EZV62_006088 [Acer yangbiense]|uniref:Cyclic nucleotide-binding domain-containing protein n=1 Tax=Acer yangbiense TaxID=1000413 RepID=A0A5C7IP71_9ROSI|nr:hypothetical protein EZV62_006088 [Acer yangbiense]
MFLIRSQGLNSEGGTAIQLYSEHRDGTTNISAAGRFQRGRDTLAKSLSKVKNWLAPRWESIACLSVIVFDPLLVYIVVVNEDKKCLSYVKNQGIMIGLVLRSVSEFLFLKYFTIPRWIALRENKKIIQNVLCSYHICCNLPFPQVFMIILLAQIRVGNNISKFLLNELIGLIAMQVLLRIVPVYIKALSRTCGLKESLPFFFYCSHVLGSIWYLFAVIAKLESWKKACKNHTGCVLPDLYCNGDSLENFIPNTTTSDFGIFKEFIQYDILEMTDFPRKLLFCLRWACQRICSFGQSLQINGEPVQDLLIIEVILFNLLLFVSIIGIIQTNNQSDAVRVERRKLNVQHIRNCMLIKKLSENLQRQVIEECERSIWIATRSILGVDAVKEFGRWGEALLDEMCDFVELVSYPKHARIVREGGTIDAMLFLVEGKLQYHNFRNVKTGGSARRRTITNYLRDGDFCGEELLPWFQADPYSSGLPISTKTIVALTNVVGFALMSDYLKSILIKHHAALFIQSYWQKRQAMRPIELSLRCRRNTQTYIQEQTPPAESFEISIENA